MATKPKRNKATSPSRTKRGGGSGTKKKVAVTPTEDTPAERQGLPARAERQGTRRIHSRKQTPAEAKARQEREEQRRADEVASQQAHRENLQSKGKGWGGLRATRRV